MIIATTPGPDRNSGAMMQFNFTPPEAMVDGTPGGLRGLGYWRPPWTGKPLDARTKAQMYPRARRRWFTPTQRPTPTARPVPMNLPPMLPGPPHRSRRAGSTAPTRSRSVRGWHRRGLSGYNFAAGPRGPVGLISSDQGGLAGLGRVRCPEGMTDNGSGVCVCYPGRVLAPGGSKCISPQSPLNTGAMTPAEVMAGQTSRTMSQQKLSAGARRFIESQGYRVNCKISERWAATPAGGVAPRLCNVCGETGCSGYKHGAYALNLRPQGGLPGQRVRPISSSGGGVPVSASHPVRAQVLPAGQAPEPPPRSPPNPPRWPPVASPPVSVADPYYPPGSVTPTAGVTYEALPQGGGPSPIFVSGGGSSFADLLSGGFNVGGYTIPYWVIAAVAAYALTRK